LVVLAILETVCIVVQMHLLSSLADEIFMHHPSQYSRSTAFVLLLGAMMFSVFFASLGAIAANALGFRMKNQTSTLLLNKLDRLGGSYGSGMQSSICVTLLTEGTDRLEDFFAHFLPQVLKCMLLPLIFLVVIFPKDWISATILLVTIPILLIFMMLIGRFSKAASEKQWKALETISGFLHDALRYMAWLKLWGKAEESIQKTDALGNLFRIKTLKVMRVAFLSAFVLEFFTMIGVALVAVGLGVRLVEGMLDFRTALFIILLAPEFYVSLRALGSKYHDSIKAIGAFRDILMFLQKEEPMRGAQQLKLQQAPTVVLEDVSYQYQSSRKGVEHISLCLKAGTTTWIVGESGCGKSTLLRVAGGLLLPQEGSVFYNGVATADVDEKEIRSAVGFIGQEVFLFGGSIYENIVLGETISIETVQKACSKIGFHNFVMSLEQGYDTLLGENGQTLSGGQKRLLSIARVLVRERWFVICDEPFAGLDEHTEQKVRQALNVLGKDRTMLIVSHRLNADEQNVLRMEQGRLCK